MALWQWTKAGRYAAADLRRTADNLIAFVCCPGPSLAQVDSAKLRGPGRIVAAVNTAYPKVDPDIWFGMDAPACYDARLFATPIPKIMGSKYADSAVLGRELREIPGVYFVQGDACRPWEMFREHTAGENFYWPPFAMNTLFTAMHVLTWMGAKKIALVGCDLGGSSDYHDDRRLTEARRKRNQKLYSEIAVELPMMRMAAEEAGIELFSCTPGSAANEFLNYRAIEDVLAGVEAMHPHTAVLDGADAEACEWRPCAEDGEHGVVVACDENADWMLPWWYRHFRRHNPEMNLLVVDLGMRAAIRKWIGQAVSVLPMRPPLSGERGWYAKPFAILRSPFKKTVWMDLDCMVREPLAPLFAAITDKMLIGDDPTEWGPINSGVIGVARGNPIVSDWAREIIRSGAHEHGDQALLARVLPRNAGHHDRLAERWNMLRWTKEGREDAAVWHLHGPAGKAWIAQEIEKSGYFTDHGSEVARVVNARWPGVSDLHGAEIGVFHGRTSATLLAKIPGLHLEMVDKWAATDSGSDYYRSGDDVARMQQGEMEKAYQEADEHTRFADLRRNILRGDSREMAALVADNSLHFVFIDGDHSESGAFADIETWYEKVMPGGIVFGHDWANPQYPGFGVERAVNRFLNQAGIPQSEIHLGKGLVWYFAKPTEAAPRIAENAAATQQGE